MTEATDEQLDDIEAVSSDVCEFVLNVLNKIGAPLEIAPVLGVLKAAAVMTKGANDADDATRRAGFLDLAGCAYDGVKVTLVRVKAGAP